MNTSLWEQFIEQERGVKKVGERMSEEQERESFLEETNYQSLKGNLER